MRIAGIKYNVIEDGPGIRTAVFVSGCRNACPGCFQQQTWNFQYGRLYSEAIKQDILNSMLEKHVRGISVLGGEPFEPENQKEILELLSEIRQTMPQKDIWCYTGCTWENIVNPNYRTYTEYTMPLLHTIDILVDGPFLLMQKDLMLKFRGSSNQRILDVKESLRTQTPVISKQYQDRHLSGKRDA